MARLFEVFFHIDFVVAERCPRFAAREIVGFGKALGIARDFHAFAAAARRRLDQNRIADFARRFFGVFDVVATAPSEPGTVGKPKFLDGLSWR